MRIGVDIGGTFTDFVVYHPDSGAIQTYKIISTPHDPSEAVLQGLNIIRENFNTNTPHPNLEIIHGSTVATNALLERKGTSTALIATRGFRDVLQIGRQNRPSLYDFSRDPHPVLVPENLRFEVTERIDHKGNVITNINDEELEELTANLQAINMPSIAISLLFSFLHPEHEQTIARKLRSAGFFVSASSEVLPEYREYERTSTTVVNAYVSPVLHRYLNRLESDLPGASLRVMQSNGGMISIEEASRFGVRCILSGPAGGIIGAQHVVRKIGSLPSPIATWGKTEERVRLITFDMGGTSTDVSLIDGAPRLTTEAVVGGCPIGTPLLDIHTIGAGGGSIASVDLGGALRVGPQSAGADPGPACYGRGDLPTVTDANLVLGRLAPEYFLGGQMNLDTTRAESAISKLADQMHMEPIQAALGVVEVVNAHMERALRVISVERGYDPQEFILLSFGGAGGLHAVDLARRLGIPKLIIPPMASTLSALGMLAANVVKDYTQTVMLPDDTQFTQIAQVLEPMVKRGLSEIQEEGIPEKDIQIECFLDIRYRGQSFELTIPFGENFKADFHEIHRLQYGYLRPESPLEIVNVRVRAIGQVAPPEIPEIPNVSSDSSTALIGDRRVVLPSGVKRIPFFQGEALYSGNSIFGPAIVVRSDTTIMLGEGDQAFVDSFQNLLISIGIR